MIGAVVNDPSPQDAAAPRGTRRLILLRHAKSAYPDGVADQERPLAPRGRREAALAGAWLVRTQPQVDAVLCSDARRARETVREALREMLHRNGIDVSVHEVAELYGASAGDVIAVAAGAPEAATTVLIVAHSPGLPQAAAVLAGPDSDSAAVMALRDGFPTSAIAVLAVPGPWSALEPGSCRLIRVHVPRD